MNWCWTAWSSRLAGLVVGADSLPPWVVVVGEAVEFVVASSFAVEHQVEGLH